jgi:D-alanyl-D-alanine carboxypeptidase
MPFLEEKSALYIKREKVIKSHDEWRRQNEVNRLRIIMTVVAVVLGISVAAGVVLALLNVKNTSDEMKKRASAYASNVVSSAEESLPEYDDSLNLLLVDSSQKIPDDYKPQLTEYASVQVDARIVPALQKMMTAAEAAGCPLTITSGYVDTETQNKKFQAEVERLMKEQKLSRLRAEDKAQATVGQGGYCDSQTGLSVCFSAKGADAGAQFNATAQYRWLQRYAADYGFILRYPDDASAADGINGKTKHVHDYSCFRYVGCDNALKMREYSMSLEEYVQYLSSRG